MERHNFKDVLDFVLSTVKINEYVNKPQKYKTTRGQDLFGYPSEMLARASLHYADHLENLEFSNASEILNTLQLSLMIEELSLIIKKALFENFKNVSFLAGKGNIGEIILELYSQFLQKPQDEIKQMLDIMVRHGFVKNNNLNMPIPLLPNMAVYIKV